MTNAHILIVDDQESIRHFIEKAMLDEGYQVSTAGEGREGLQAVTRSEPDLVLLDLRLPDMHGLDVLKKLKEDDPDLQVIIMTAFGDVESAVRAMKLGAHDYINKPINLEQLFITVEKALESRKLWRELRHLRRQQSDRFSRELVRGDSPRMREVYETVEQVATSDSTSVLIQGESGTGKEHLANMIHELSTRRDKPFMEINCAAIPKELLESELFGHEKGAFTDARAQKQGLLEMANGGTLFLDEVGEMSLQIQVKLLRVLERMTFKRVGGTKDITVSVRIISATNQDLSLLMEQGRFREDLFFRINVIPIVLPPLRERREDIPLLVEHFLELNAGKTQKPITGLSREAMEIFYRYDWPGNVRELINVIDYAFVLCNEGVIQPDHLPSTLTGKRHAPARPRRQVTPGPQRISREELLNTLQAARGKKTRAAEMLGVSRVTLWKWLKEHNVQVESVVRD
jgi:two-component system response regulator AtoC